MKILKGLAEYLDFEINSSDEKKKEELLAEILVPRNKNADLKELNKVFTGKNLDAKKLRTEAWGWTK